MTDLVANYIMEGRPGATRQTTSSPTVQETQNKGDENVSEVKTVQEPDNEDNENLSEVKTRRFRARAKRPKHKNADELRLRVSCI